MKSGIVGPVKAVCQQDAGLQWPAQRRLYFLRAARAKARKIVRAHIPAGEEAVSRIEAVESEWGKVEAEEIKAGLHPTVKLVKALEDARKRIAAKNSERDD